jgi:hypothetical protein
MSLTFREPSNSSIDHLVTLCSPTLNSSDNLLLTPLLDELNRSSSDEAGIEDEPEVSNVMVHSSLLNTSTPIQIPITAFPFTPPTRIIKDLIIAVDSGIITLGILRGGGIAFAVRGAAVCYSGKNLLILRYRTGALFINQQNVLPVFRYIGTRLGNPDLYVTEHNGQLIPQASVIQNANQITDRCRNFVERMIQEEAIGILASNGGGTLLIDGALAISYDTPGAYLKTMISSARNRAIAICAISKRSHVTIGGLPIDALFDQYPTFVGFAPLFAALETERQGYRALNLRPASEISEAEEIYAVRFGFGPPALTFRVDVCGSPAAPKEDVLNDIYSKTQMYGGYPRPLIDAHHYSTFLPGDAVSILADLVVRTGIQIKEQPSMGVLFQPFGAFGK